MNSQASRDPSPRLVVQKALARVLPYAVLVLGWVSYVLLCLPLLRSRGYDPGPFWDAMVWLWVVPLMLYFVVRPGGSKCRWTIVFYCTACAWVGAAIPMALPSRFDFQQSLWLWPFSALAYIFAGIMLSFLVQIVVKFKRFIMRNGVGGCGGISVLPRLVLSIVLLACGIAFPWGYRAAAIYDLASQGRQDARHKWQWAARSTSVRDDAQPKYLTISGLAVTEYFDPHTGMSLEPFTPLWTFFRPKERQRYNDAFEQELERLIQQHGLPKWSVKHYLIPSASLAVIFRTRPAKVIAHFPFRINGNITMPKADRVSAIPVGLPKTRPRYIGSGSHQKVRFGILDKYHGDIAVMASGDVLVYAPTGALLYEVNVPSPPCTCP